MIITLQVCSNCRKRIGAHCDGKIYVPDYTSPEGNKWERPVCHGSDGPFPIRSGELSFCVVIGHGNKQFVPLIHRPDL